MSRSLINKRNSELLIYLNGLVSGKYTLRQASESTGYSIRWLSKLKKRFILEGADCLIHGNTNHVAWNKTPETLKQKIVAIYADRYQGINFRYFCECLEEYEDIKINLSTLYNIMEEYGIRSPEGHRRKKPKKVHRPRFRRENEGDLIQLDGTPYQWFDGNNNYYDLMGAIDDATGKITGLYMCENECFYGYCEVLRMTFNKYGKPREVYTDRAAIFCCTPKKKKDLTVWEQLQGVHDKKTQWQRAMEDLNIRQILAWSPQAKGRVERMWGTVQKRLPLWFKKHGITTVEAANKALPDFIEYFNKHFAVTPKSDQTFWLPVPSGLDDILCAQIPRLTDSNGCFSFHSYKFAIRNCSHTRCKKIMLCISELGIEAKVDGKKYPVQILDDVREMVATTRGDDIPQVLKDIIYRYLWADQKQLSA